MVRSTLNFAGAEAKQRRMSHSRWVVITLAFFATVVNYLDRQTLSVIAPELKRQFQMTDETYGLILSAFMLAYTVMNGVSGPIIDRIGTKLGYGICIAWWSTAGMLHALATGPVSLGIYRFLLGAGEAGNWPAAVKVVSEWFSAKERALASGIFNSGAAIGALIAPPSVAWLALSWGWPTAFKPTLDGEPRYERIPVGFYYATSNPFNRFEAYDARQAAYWSLLAGACGHTYGHNSVWQMWTRERRPVISADTPWTESLDHPGAFQMGYVRRLFESRPFQKLVSSPSMVLDGPRSGAAKIRAACASDGSFAFVYSPAGEKFTVDQSLVKGARLKEIWYDPRYGVAREIHTGTSKAIQIYTPPSAGRGCDWILILEDEAEKFLLPGAAR